MPKNQKSKARIAAIEAKKGIFVCKCGKDCQKLDNLKSHIVLAHRAAYRIHYENECYVVTEGDEEHTSRVPVPPAQKVKKSKQRRTSSKEKTEKTSEVGATAASNNA